MDISFVTTINSRLQEAGYRAAHDEPKRRYYRSMVRLAGELKGLAFLRDTYMLRLFSNAQMKKGTAYTFSELKQIADPQQHFPRFVDQMHHLARKQVFLRGYRLRCPECDLETWYDLSNVAERTTCQGCRTEFQMPLELDFAYRLNQLFVAGLNQGAASVLLAALMLHDLSEYSMMWDTGYQVKKEGPTTDIDLIAMCDGALVLAECKDNFDADTPEQIENLRAQLARSIAVARDLDAHLFLFAALYDEELPSEIVDYLGSVDQRERSLATRVLTRADLLRGSLPMDEDRPARIRDLVKSLPLHDGDCFESDSQSPGWSIVL